jgi:hypothetical protein
MFSCYYDIAGRQWNVFQIVNGGAEAVSVVHRLHEIVGRLKNL